MTDSVGHKQNKRLFIIFMALIAWLALSLTLWSPPALADEGGGDDAPLEVQSDVGDEGDDPITGDDFENVVVNEDEPTDDGGSNLVFAVGGTRGVDNENTDPNNNNENTDPNNANNENTDSNANNENTDPNNNNANNENSNNTNSNNNPSSTDSNSNAPSTPAEPAANAATTQVPTGSAYIEEYGDAVLYNNSNTDNAIQLAVNAALQKANNSTLYQKDSITIVVKDGTYEGTVLIEPKVVTKNPDGSETSSAFNPFVGKDNFTIIIRSSSVVSATDDALAQGGVGANVTAFLHKKLSVTFGMKDHIYRIGSLFTEADR